MCNSYFENLSDANSVFVENNLNVYKREADGNHHQTKGRTKDTFLMNKMNVHESEVIKCLKLKPKATTEFHHNHFALGLVGSFFDCEMITIRFSFQKVPEVHVRSD